MEPQKDQIADAYDMNPNTIYYNNETCDARIRKFFKEGET